MVWHIVILLPFPEIKLKIFFIICPRFYLYDIREEYNDLSYIFHSSFISAKLVFSVNSVKFATITAQ